MVHIVKLTVPGAFKTPQAEKRKSTFSFQHYENFIINLNTRYEMNTFKAEKIMKRNLALIIIRQTYRVNSSIFFIFILSLIYCVYKT